MTSKLDHDGADKPNALDNLQVHLAGQNPLSCSYAARYM